MPFSFDKWKVEYFSKEAFSYVENLYNVRLVVHPRDELLLHASHRSSRGESGFSDTEPILRIHRKQPAYLQDLQQLERRAGSLKPPTQKSGTTRSRQTTIARISAQSNTTKWDPESNERLHVRDLETVSSHQTK